MPSKSKAQHNLMAMVANDPKAAKRLGISKSVGEEFMKADKGKKFKKGGDVAEERMEPATMSKIPQGNKAFGQHAVQKKGFTKGKNLGDSGKVEPIQKEKRFKKGGAIDGIAERGKTKGRMI